MRLNATSSVEVLPSNQEISFSMSVIDDLESILRQQSHQFDVPPRVLAAMMFDTIEVQNGRIQIESVATAVEALRSRSPQLFAKPVQDAPHDPAPPGAAAIPPKPAPDLTDEQLADVFRSAAKSNQLAMTNRAEYIRLRNLAIEKGLL
jgi:hypothetical protein